MEANYRLPRGTVTNDQLTFFEWIDEEAKPSRFNTCQCGAVATYGAEMCAKQPFLHSFWCPEFRDTRDKENSVDKAGVG